jgi:hypothetical protein
LFICIFTQVLASGGDFWISFWYGSIIILIPMLKNQNYEI